MTYDIENEGLQGMNISIEEAEFVMFVLKYAKKKNINVNKLQVTKVGK